MSVVQAEGKGRGQLEAEGRVSVEAGSSEGRERGPRGSFFDEVGSGGVDVFSPARWRRHREVRASAG